MHTPSDMSLERIRWREYGHLSIDHSLPVNHKNADRNKQNVFKENIEKFLIFHPLFLHSCQVYSHAIVKIVHASIHILASSFETYVNNRGNGG